LAGRHSSFPATDVCGARVAPALLALLPLA